MNYFRKNKKLLGFLCVLCIVTIPTLLPLLHKGFFVTDDGEWMIIRFSAFHQALRDGQFPVRFLSRLNHGYGYPVANFLYPGFMYFAEPLKLVGFGFVNTIKVLLGFSMVLSGVFTFFWLRRLFHERAAFLGAIVALYSPYHLYDAYTRGSVGEIVSLAIVPFVLWQIERKSFLWLSLGIAALIVSHNTLAILFLPILVLYMLLSVKRSDKTLFFQYVFTLLASLGLSAFFWLPIVSELHYTRFSSVTVSDISNYFASPQLIGVGSLFVFGLSLFFVSKKQENKKISLTLLLFTALSAMSIFYSSALSSSLWQYLPSSFIQFPFRLLSYLVVSISFLSAYALFYFKGTMRWVIGGIVLLLVGFSSASYLQPKEFFDKGEAFYATNEDTTTVKNEYMPKWSRQDPTEHARDIVSVNKPQTIIRNVVASANRISFSVDANEVTLINVNRLYYPGWKVLINGKRETQIVYNNTYGTIGFFVPSGHATIALSFTETPLRLLSDILSIISFVAIIMYHFFILFNKKSKKYA